jgi:hypothetical protein
MAFYGIEYRKRPSIDMFEAFTVSKAIMTLDSYDNTDNRCHFTATPSTLVQFTLFHFTLDTLTIYI